MPSPRPAVASPRAIVAMRCGLASLALSVAACNAKPAPPEPTPTQAPRPSAAPAARDPQVPCTLTRVEEGISNLQLQSEDGACRVFLPLDVSPGEYPVRVSAAGDERAAAVEARTDDGPLFATEGSVTVTRADADGLAGAVSASDRVDPVRGQIEVTFDLSRTP